MQNENSASSAWESQLLAALTALKNGDLSVRLPTGQGGTAQQIAETYNATVQQLNTLVAESRRIAQEIAPMGKYGGQAQVEGLQGHWAHLRDDVNLMAGYHTAQI